jgi:type IV secretory pathway TraG/TraD family ATPase VirD4
VSAVTDLVATERETARKEAFGEARRALGRKVHAYAPGSIEAAVVEACLAEIDKARGAP